MLNVIWGSNRDKPEAATALADSLSQLSMNQAYLYIGYPIVGSPLGPVKFDALLVSKEHGIIGFDLVEGIDLGDYRSRQDEIASMLEVKLKPYPLLKKGRDLAFNIGTVTFAPAKSNLPPNDAPYLCANRITIGDSLSELEPIENEALIKNLLAAVQVVTTIRTSGKNRREAAKPESRGALLKKIEDSIANLDQHQSRAVIETVDGLQRIRGLAGSGKTIILALKVAYLHSQNPEWNVAVTFNTRSLKEQFRRLITTFTIEQTGTEPDWDRVSILNAWGAPGGRDQDGIYHQFCRENKLPFLDFTSAKIRSGSSDRAFGSACALAISAARDPSPIYDLILVDEAQDFPPEFLRLCHKLLNEPKRLVYAYDELQTLTSGSVLPPEELFGRDSNGTPLVKFDASDSAIPRQDIILEKCYRNSRPVLATAHALGFGIYRDAGLVQMFDHDSLWLDVGYHVESGSLSAGSQVTLSRSPETSPLFLEDHSPHDDLIQFQIFQTHQEQSEWLAREIQKNIKEEDLRPEDIVVINPDPLKTSDAVGLPRALLHSLGINNELAGVSTSRDVFSKDGAVTFTGIFRAKGNEAGMIYVINAQDCFSGISKAQLAINRNRIFTAITRSKAWVRVLGIGRPMEELITEWQRLRSNDYKLTFTYPTAEEKAKLKIINVDLTPRQLAKEKKLSRHRDMLLDAAKKGELDVQQLIMDLQKAADQFD